jgi:hypothetical protein
VIWLTNDDLIAGDEHGNIYRWSQPDEKPSKFNNPSLSDKQHDEVQFFAIANKQKFILATA